MLEKKVRLARKSEQKDERKERRGSVRKTPRRDDDAANWFETWLPEYLWWDAMFEAHGAKGMERARRVLDLVATAARDPKRPVLGFVSDFERVAPDKRKAILGDLHKALGAPMKHFAAEVALFKGHPMAWIFEGMPRSEEADAEKFLGSQIESLRDLGSSRAVRAQHATIVELARAGQIIPSVDLSDFVTGLVDFQYIENNRRAAELISAMSLSLFGMVEHDSAWPARFWSGNRTRTPCVPAPARGQRSTGSGKSGVTPAKLAALREGLDQLARDAVSCQEDQRVAEAVLGLVGRCVRITEDMAGDPMLRSPPWGKTGLWLLAQHAIDALYVLQQPSEVAEAYRAHSGGERSGNAYYAENFDPTAIDEDADESSDDDFTDAAADIVEVLTDARWDDWAGVSTRKRAEAVGRKDLQRLVLTPASNEVHGAWSSTRHWEMTPCVAPTHCRHLVPHRADAGPSKEDLVKAHEITKGLIREVGTKWGPARKGRASRSKGGSAGKARKR